MDIDSTEVAIDRITASFRLRGVQSLVFLFIFILVLVFDYRPLQEPTSNDGAIYPLLARVAVGETSFPGIELEQGKGIWHPMLYQMVLIGLAKTIGSDLIYARIFGFSCGLLNACLLIWLVLLVVPDGPSRTWTVILAIAIYVTNPWGRLGMLHPDIDTTIMPPLLLAATGSAVSACRHISMRGVLYMVLLQAAALWAKLTTPILLPFSLGLRFILEKREITILWIPVGVGLGGGVVFLTSWWVYCAVMGYPAAALVRIIDVFLEKVRDTENLLQFSRRLFGMIYWFNPAFLLAAGLGSWLLFRKGCRSRLPADLVMPGFLGWSIFLLYIFLGGITFTIPKYQYSAVPFLTLVIAVAIGRDVHLHARNYHMPAVLSLVCTAYYYWFGDHLYRFFYGSRVYLWKNVMAAQVPVGYVSVIITDFVLVMIPILAVVSLALLGKPGERLSYLFRLSVAVMFAYNIGLGAIQAQATYTTTFNYGMQDAEAVLDRINDNATVLIYEAAILGPWNTKTIHFTRLNHRSRQELIHSLEHTDFDYLVVGLAINTLGQLLQLQQDPELKRILKEEFVEERIGDFILYRKREQ